MPVIRNALKNSVQHLVWIVLAGVWLASPCYAAESASGIRQITPPGEMSSYSHRANVSAEKFFDVIGILNLIEGDRLIIGDKEYKMVTGVKNSRARQWHLVGAKLNRAGEVVMFETISDDPN